MLVGGILLAAGGSTRLGYPKQLLELDGKTLVEIALEKILQILPQTITVVTGGSAEKVRAKLKGKNINLAYNENWQSGMASSIKTGMQNLLKRLPEVDAVMICLCDQPFLTSDHLEALLKATEDKPQKIIASHYNNLASVPAIFKKSVFEDLLNLEGQQGARRVIRKSEEQTFTVPFAKGIYDVDTVEDWEKIKVLHQQQKKA